jgi:hypothetical protein
VRLALLNDKAKTGKVRTGYLGRQEVGIWISKADVAGFMLVQIEDARYIRRAPAISD